MEKPLGKTIRTFNSRMQARLLLVFCVITSLMVGLMGRLIYITQSDGDRYAKQVLSRQSYVSAVLPYKRGTITDRNGTVLAVSELQYRLILDPKLLLQNPDCVTPTLKALKDDFNIDNNSVQTILQDKPDSQYIIVQKNLKYDVVKSFETKMEQDHTITGVWFEEEYVRTYPYNTLACDVLGFTSADNQGYWGMEEYYNNELNGTNGREYGYYDSNLNIERIEKKAVNGNSIVSTIDANVQRIIQEKITQFNADTGSKNIGVLVMNPNNGEILAMASNKEYNLNKPQDLTGIYSEEELTAMTADQKTEALNALWKNDDISSGFEPGSTFKPITIAAGLEEGVLKPEDTFYCDGGEEVGGVYIHCNKRAGHGELTLGQALMFSCNDALMQIVAKEGKDIFHRYQSSFGFGKKTGIDLPGEDAGIIQSYDSLGPTELATSSFGQSFNATPIQMAAAFSSLVNGGSYYQPHIVKQIVNDNGATVKDIKGTIVRQTASKSTSDFIQEYMYQTVETGTAGGAKVEGYAVGGKTGTAQKLPRDAKTYIVSFLGCVPAVNPEMVIYVWIDEPQNVVKQADSSIATKFASKILQEILPVLGIYPDGQIDYLLQNEDAATGTTAGTTAGNTTGTTTETTTGNTTGTTADGTATVSSGTQTNNTTAQEGTQSQNPESTTGTGSTPGTETAGNNTASNNQTSTGNQGTTQSGQNNNSGNTGGNSTQGANTTNNTGNTGSADNTNNSQEDDYNADALD